MVQLPCTNLRKLFVQLLTLHSELLDTLIKAVHALYQDSKAGSQVVDARDVTTHAILESLGLIEQENSDPEAELKYVTTEKTCNPILPVSPPSSQIFTGSECLQRPDVTSLVSHEIQGSSGGLPSPESVGYIEGQLALFIDSLPISPPTWQPQPTPTGLDDYHLVESNHSIPFLFGTDLPEHISPFSDIWTADTAPTIPFRDDATSIMLNDFSFLHRPVEGTRWARDEFGFDPDPSSSGHSLIETNEVDIINNWPDARQYIDKWDFESLSAQADFCIDASTLPDVQRGVGGNLLPMSTDLPSHNSTVSPTELDSRTPSGHELPARPTQRKRGRPKIEDSDESTDCGHVSAVRSNKRRKKRDSDSSSAKSQMTESERRQVSLEKNRHAASRCREKKRWEIDLLKETSQDNAAENTLLKQQTTKMQEETLRLRFELMTHMSHPGCCRPEEVKKFLDDNLQRYTSIVHPSYSAAVPN